MKRICSWCKLDMGEAEPFDDPSITHGICLECLVTLEEEMDGFYDSTEGIALLNLHKLHRGVNES